MIRVLKNISVRLWIISLVSIPLVFYILPFLTSFFPGINTVGVYLLSISFVALLTSFLMDTAAKRTILSLIKEGRAWERSGIFQKAEKSYEKALRIYDTFLLWPFFARKIMAELSGAVAKFDLTAPALNPAFRLCSSIYLRINPDDAYIAQLWLLRLKKAGIVTSFEQEILSVLAEKYDKDPMLSPVILDIFLSLDRKDYIARKFYTQLSDQQDTGGKYSRKIEAAAGISGETPEHETLRAESIFDPEAVPSFNRPGKKSKNIAAVWTLALKMLLSSLKTVLNVFIAGISRAVLLFKKGYEFFRQSEKAKIYVKTGCLILVSIWLFIFIANTVSYMFRSKPVQDELVETPVIVEKPFTIQVAAYLKQNHANGYADSLKKKNLDASVKKVDGGGKTWYVVRISEFETKQEAADYGKQLKSEKKIEDFFVNNK